LCQEKNLAASDKLFCHNIKEILASEIVSVGVLKFEAGLKKTQKANYLLIKVAFFLSK